jgi:hypothetical protein
VLFRGPRQGAAARGCLTSIAGSAATSSSNVAARAIKGLVAAAAPCATPRGGQQWGYVEAAARATHKAAAGASTCKEDACGQVQPQTKSTCDISRKHMLTMSRNPCSAAPGCLQEP